jgi:hypothetical protein
MSGGQGGGRRFQNALTLLMNFERPATCRYHMPYVVAYVVPDVEAVRGRGNAQGAVISKFRWVDRRSAGMQRRLSPNGDKPERLRRPLWEPVQPGSHAF